MQAQSTESQEDLRVEAAIYIFKDDSEILVKQGGLPDLIRNFQDECQPEIGIVFQDTKNPVTHTKQAA